LERPEQPESTAGFGRRLGPCVELHALAEFLSDIRGRLDQFDHGVPLHLGRIERFTNDGDADLRLHLDLLRLEEAADAVAATHDLQSPEFDSSKTTAYQ